VSRKFSLKAKQTVLFLLILCEMVIHGPFANNNYWAFTIFYNMSITFIAYMGIIAFLDTYEKYEIFVKYWIMTFIFLAFVGMTNKGKGVGGFIGDENDFCMALNMILPFVIFGIFMDKSKLYKIYCVILTGLFLFVIALTESRGGFIGLVSVVLYCVWKSNRKMALGILICIFSVFLYIVAPSGYWQEIGTISDEASQNSEKLESQVGTGAQRLYSWKLGWGMFVDNPIMGVGQGNYPWNVMEQEEKMNINWKTRSLAGRAAHSLYFTLLPELGIIGTVLFFTIIIYVWKDLLWVRYIIKKDILFTSNLNKNIYYNTLAIEASIIGYLSSSVFISTLYYPNFWLLTAIMVALKNIVSDYHDRNDNSINN
jgi:O-antigen ligase